MRCLCHISISANCRLLPLQAAGGNKFRGGVAMGRGHDGCKMEPIFYRTTVLASLLLPSSYIARFYIDVQCSMYIYMMFST